MIDLKVIQYVNSNGLEATWLDAEGVQLKCHSYADVQMQMFRDDASFYGTPLDEYEGVIADIESKIIPYTPPPPVIPPNSPRQIRQALTALGLRSAVEFAVSQSNQDTKDWWEFATSFERNHPMVVSMGQALGKTSEELDALFNYGASL